ncbi:conserved hypothetical protein [Capnocytophaga canimorsus]|uniref:Uncharacterized protein n=1 Tax=Capnocytophaga canimorsus TaxID=28188 RepID=A0A0B7IAD2_9FLAO|nr:conserved hypothetical protein [Capnocytophaga canimorsus]
MLINGFLKLKINLSPVRASRETGINIANPKPLYTKVCPKKAPILLIQFCADTFRSPKVFHMLWSACQVKKYDTNATVKTTAKNNNNIPKTSRRCLDLFSLFSVFLGVGFCFLEAILLNLLVYRTKEQMYLFFTELPNWVRQTFFKVLPPYFRFFYVFYFKRISV